MREAPPRAARWRPPRGASPGNGIPAATIPAGQDTPGITIKKSRDAAERAPSLHAGARFPRERPL
jgi:hypothetical protein